MVEGVLASPERIARVDPSSALTGGFLWQVWSLSAILGYSRSSSV
jgi:hypothetical protein